MFVNCDVYSTVTAEEIRRSYVPIERAVHLPSGLVLNF